LILKIKSKIWLETENGVLLSEGRVQLLKMIDQTGSLNKASKSLNISYQKAWRLVDESNKTSKLPLIETTIGGNNGGGSKLTPYGRNLVESFDKINSACWEFLDNQLKNHSL
jgi:molybdate transport system regulatory protein